jgi:hypothetical protein
MMMETGATEKSNSLWRKIQRIRTVTGKLFGESSDVQIEEPVVPPCELDDGETSQGKIGWDIYIWTSTG